MKKLAKINYVINYRFNKYNIDSFNLEIYDHNIISRYTNQKITSINISNIDGEYYIKKYDDELVLSSSLINMNLFSSGTIADLINFKLPIIYNKDTICDNIIKRKDHFIFIIPDKHIELSFNNNSIIVIHPFSNTIYEYKSNVYSELFESKHIITDQGIISEYFDDRNERKKDIILTNGKDISTIESFYKSLVPYQTDIEYHYITNIYTLYKRDNQYKQIFKNNNPYIINFKEFVSENINYADRYEDYDVIIDPLFPEESLKGNKIHFNNIKVETINKSDTMKKYNKISIEMILYNPEKIK